MSKIMDTPDKLYLTTKDNEELAALFANKQPGDTVKLELEVQLDEKTDDGVACSVNTAAPVNADEPDEDDSGDKTDDTAGTEAEDSSAGAGAMSAGSTNSGREMPPVMIALGMKKGANRK